MIIILGHGSMFKSATIIIIRQFGENLDTLTLGELLPPH